MRYIIFGKTYLLVVAIHQLKISLITQVKMATRTQLTR